MSPPSVERVRLHARRRYGPPWLATEAMALAVSHRYLERRSSHRSESQDEQTPSPLMGEGRGGGEARHGVRGLCRPPPPPIPTVPRDCVGGGAPV